VPPPPATLTHPLASQADTNKSGLITFREFLRWPGRQAVLGWIDLYHERVVAAILRGQEAPPIISQALVDAHPWSRLTSKDVLHLWRAEAWRGPLSLRDFERLVLRLGPHWVEDREEVVRLFQCFDQDGSGHLDARELFIGLTLLCAESREERLRAMFTLMDANGTGRISRDELETFIRFLWPPGADSMHECRITLRTSRIMLEADQDRSGFISFAEYMRWDGKELELKMMDARLAAIMSKM
jgi:Ca2+-binding EF-hand superfamily protein